MTLRCFRETFENELVAAGFDEAITPFITANAGFDPLADRELRNSDRSSDSAPRLRLTPQFIGKDPIALRFCLQRVKSAGFETADLNCGCPFPMVRNKGRGSGILRTPDVLRQMMEVGCEVMGEGRFSLKARLGIERNDELLGLMPLINLFPLRFLTVHARTARQMYEGACDREAFRRIASVAKVPLVYNGDVALPAAAAPTVREGPFRSDLMIGRAFVRHLGAREDAPELALRYLEASVCELNGDFPVLGRMKELICYWKEMPMWHRRWSVVKLARSVTELRQALN